MNITVRDKTDGRRGSRFLAFFWLLYVVVGWEVVYTSIEKKIFLSLILYYNRNDNLLSWLARENNE